MNEFWINSFVEIMLGTALLIGYFVFLFVTGWIISQIKPLSPKHFAIRGMTGTLALGFLVFFLYFTFGFIKFRVFGL